MVEVEDAVGWLGSVDTAQEFNILVIVGRWEVDGQAAVERAWAILWRELALEEGSRDIVAAELNKGQVVVLDGVGDNGGDCEEEEMVVTGGSVGGRVNCGAGGVLFHGAEASCHALEGVVREELQLQEHEESVVDSVGRDVGFVNELQRLVSNEHLFHLFVDGRSNGVAVARHCKSFLDGELRLLALGDEQRRCSGPEQQLGGQAEPGWNLMIAGGAGCVVGADGVAWLEGSRGFRRW